MAWRGPEYVLDDWFALANARFDGWWRAAGSDQWRARPGAGVVYAATFGLVGRHPLAALVVQVAIAAVAAVLLRRVVTVVLGSRAHARPLGWAVAGAWVLVPNHTSLLVWASATNITVALVLLLAGVLAIARDRPWLAGAALAGSVLCYEATAPAAVVVAVVVPLLLGRRPWRVAVVVGGWLAPAGAWMLAHPHPAKSGLDVHPDLAQIVPAHVGWGVFPAGAFATAAGTTALVVLAVMVVLAVRTRTVVPETGLALGGVALIVLGTVPYVRYFYAPLGFGDRVNVVAGVGTAMLWVGVLAWSAARLPQPGVAGVAGVAAATAVVVGGFAVAWWQAAGAWADAQDEAAARLARVGPVHAGDTVVVPRSRLRRNVAAFLDDSNWSGAVQLEAGTRDVDASLGPPTPGR